MRLFKYFLLLLVICFGCKDEEKDKTNIKTNYKNAKDFKESVLNAKDIIIVDVDSALYIKHRKDANKFDKILKRFTTLKKLTPPLAKIFRYNRTSIEEAVNPIEINLDEQTIIGERPDVTFLYNDISRNINRFTNQTDIITASNSNPNEALEFNFRSSLNSSLQTIRYNNLLSDDVFDIVLLETPDGHALMNKSEVPPGSYTVSYVYAGQSFSNVHRLRKATCYEDELYLAGNKLQRFVKSEGQGDVDSYEVIIDGNTALAYIIIVDKDAGLARNKSKSKSKIAVAPLCLKSVQTPEVEGSTYKMTIPENEVEISYTRESATVIQQ